MGVGGPEYSGIDVNAIIIVESSQRKKIESNKSKGNEQ